MKKEMMIIVIGLALVGCKSITPATSYIGADRMTKTAVEPIMTQAKKDHPDLAPDIDNTLESWESRLKSAEVAKGETPAPTPVR